MSLEDMFGQMKRPSRPVLAPEVEIENLREGRRLWSQRPELEPGMIVRLKRGLLTEESAQGTRGGCPSGLYIVMVVWPDAKENKSGWRSDVRLGYYGHTGDWQQSKMDSRLVEPVP